MVTFAGSIRAASCCRPSAKAAVATVCCAAQAPSACCDCAISCHAPVVDQLLILVEELEQATRGLGAGPTGHRSVSAALISSPKPALSMATTRGSCSRFRGDSQRDCAAERMADQDRVAGAPACRSLPMTASASR